ncbi:hypothetical protein RUND412_000171 [Rhizina undulata]
MPPRVRVPHPKDAYPQITPADVKILDEIISLASAIPGRDPTDWLYRAYDAILHRRGINPAEDSIYYRFILQINEAEGSTSLHEKFSSFLKGFGVDPSIVQSIPSTTAATTKDTHKWYEESKQLGQRVARQLNASDDGYEAEDESPHLMRRIEVRDGENSYSPLDDEESSPTAAAQAEEEAAKIYRAETSRQIAEARTRTIDFEKAHRIPERERFFQNWKNGKVLKKWRRQTEAKVQRTQEAREQILSKKYLNAWKEWILTNEERAHHFRMAKTLSKMRKRHEMKQKAVKFYREGLIIRSYWTWYLEFRGILSLQRYGEKLVRQKFDTWMYKTAYMIKQRHRAEKFLCKKFFKVWREEAERRKKQEDSGYNRAKSFCLRRIFNRWLRETIFRVCLKNFTPYVDHRIICEKLLVWRLGTSSSRKAAAHRRERMLLNGFQYWRLQLRRRAMKQTLEERLQFNTLRNWVLQLRLRQLTRERNRESLRNYFHLWAEKRRRLSKKLQDRESRITPKIAARIVRTAFLYWRHKLKYLRKEERRAEEKHRQTTLRKYFDRMRSKHKKLEEHNEKASIARDYFTLKPALTLWRAAMKKSRHEKLRQIYHRVARNRKRALAAAALKRWKDKDDYLRNKRVQAADHFNKITVKLSHRLFYHWLEKTRKLIEQDSKATNYNAARLWSIFRVRWEATLDRISKQTMDCYKFQQWLDNRLCYRLLRRLELKVFNIRYLHMKREGWLPKNLKRRNTVIFRKFRENILKRREGGDVVTDDLDDFFKKSVYRPVGGGLSTPGNLLVTTPGWKSVQRRSIFGRGSFGTPLGSPGSPLRRFGRGID